MPFGALAEAARGRAAWPPRAGAPLTCGRAARRFTRRHKRRRRHKRQHSAGERLATLHPHTMSKKKSKTKDYDQKAAYEDDGTGRRLYLTSSYLAPHRRQLSMATSLARSRSLSHASGVAWRLSWFTALSKVARVLVWPLHLASAAWCCATAVGAPLAIKRTLHRFLAAPSPPLTFLMDSLRAHILLFLLVRRSAAVLQALSDWLRRVFSFSNLFSQLSRARASPSATAVRTAPAIRSS